MPPQQSQPTESLPQNRYGMQFIDLENFTVDGELIRQFPVQDLFREHILPLDSEGSRVRVAIADPLPVSYTHLTLPTNREV